MTVGEFLVLIDRVKNLCGVAGAKAGALKNLQLFAEGIRPHSAKSVEVFCAAAREAIAQGATKKSAGKRKPSVGATKALDENAIKTHLERLQDAGTNRSVFETALAELRADKSIKAAGFSEIARRYSLSVTKYKSVAAALGDIEQAFVRRARFENKLS